MYIHSIQYTVNGAILVYNMVYGRNTCGIHLGIHGIQYSKQYTGKYTVQHARTVKVCDIMENSHHRIANHVSTSHRIYM